MKKLIIANFKSNKSINSASIWIDTVIKGLDKSMFETLDIAVAPTFMSTTEYSKTIKKSGLDIKLTVQNISKFPAGSYTGAVPAQCMEGLGIEYAIVGHSERRKYFNETSADVALKVEQAIDHGITPVICLDTDYLDEQLAVISKAYLKKCVIAYEPLSAIGSGNNCPVNEVKDVGDRVKKICGNVPYLYGGSVNDQNVNEYLIVADGFIVGSASLKADSFLRLVRAAKVS